MNTARLRYCTGCGDGVEWKTGPQRYHDCKIPGAGWSDKPIPFTKRHAWVQRTLDETNSEYVLVRRENLVRLQDDISELAHKRGGIHVAVRNGNVDLEELSRQCEFYGIHLEVI